MRKSNKPTPIKPELVNVGDMIEVLWDKDGVRYSVCAYVGAKAHVFKGLEYEILAGNLQTVLFKYLPAEGITFPDPSARLVRHRQAPDNYGVLI